MAEAYDEPFESTIRYVRRSGKLEIGRHRAGN